MQINLSEKESACLIDALTEYINMKREVRRKCRVSSGIDEEDRALADASVCDASTARRIRSRILDTLEGE